MKKLISLLCMSFCLLFIMSCGESIKKTTNTEDKKTCVELNNDYEDVEMFDINTSVLTLKYPSKWKDIIETEITEDGVKFFSDGVELFDVMFIETEDGYLLGTYNETPIYIEVPQNAKTDEQIEMQSDVNAIIENIEKDPNFSK